MTYAKTICIADGLAPMLTGQCRSMQTYMYMYIRHFVAIQQNECTICTKCVYNVAGQFKGSRIRFT